MSIFSSPLFSLQFYRPGETVNKMMRMTLWSVAYEVNLTGGRAVSSLHMSIISSDLTFMQGLWFDLFKYLRHTGITLSVRLKQEKLIPGCQQIMILILIYH